VRHRWSFRAAAVLHPENANLLSENISAIFPAIFANQFGHIFAERLVSVHPFQSGKWPIAEAHLVAGSAL
jgi:hypothetical protein